MNERRSYNNQGGYIALTAHSFTSSTYGNDNTGGPRERRHYSDGEGNGSGRFGRRNNRNAPRYNNDRRNDRPLQRRGISSAREQDNFEDIKKKEMSSKHLVPKAAENLLDKAEE